MARPHGPIKTSEARLRGQEMRFGSLLDGLGIPSGGLVYVVEQLAHRVVPCSRACLGCPSPSLPFIPLALMLLQVDEKRSIDDIGEPDSNLIVFRARLD